MDIQKFQEKLAEICELGEKSGKILKPQQIKECFGEMDLDKSQLIKILQYLKLKGITIEGAEVALHTSGEEQETEPEEQEQKVPLTPEEEEYLKEYLEGLEEQKAGVCPVFWLPVLPFPQVHSLLWVQKFQGGRTVMHSWNPCMLPVRSPHPLRSHHPEGLQQTRYG